MLKEYGWTFPQCEYVEPQNLYAFMYPNKTLQYDQPTKTKNKMCDTEFDYNDIHKKSPNYVCTKYGGPLSLSPDDLRDFKPTKFEYKMPANKILLLWEILPTDIVGIINEYHKIPSVDEIATGFSSIIDNKNKKVKFSKHGGAIPYNPNIYFRLQPNIIQIIFPYGGNVFITLNRNPINSYHLYISLNELIMHLMKCTQINCITNCGTEGNLKFLILSIVGFNDKVGTYSCINLFDTDYLLFFQPIVRKKTLSFFINE